MKLSEIQLQTQFDNWLVSQNISRRYNNAEEVLDSDDLDLDDSQVRWLESWDEAWNAAPEYNAQDVYDSSVNGQLEQAKQQASHCVSVADFMSFCAEMPDSETLYHIKKIYGDCTP